jgi:hypothetical protein
VSTEDKQDLQSSRAWRVTRATALIEPHGGQVTCEFFDHGQSRSVPPQRRPEASRLLSALASPDRDFDAVVIGEPQRAFYGAQFGSTFLLFAHWGVPLWVPEISGAIDPGNEAHDLIMSVFGGSQRRAEPHPHQDPRSHGGPGADRGPFPRRTTRPTATCSSTRGPHPNPARAADGRRLHALGTDQAAAAIVRRIFAQYIDGLTMQMIANGLTLESTPSPARSRLLAG